MNRLNLSEINLNIPYTVWEKDGAYLFKTDYGIVYKISFMEDDTIWDSGAYQFLITNLSNVASPNDSKIKLTILYFPSFAAVCTINSIKVVKYRQISAK